MKKLYMRRGTVHGVYTACVRESYNKDVSFRV